MKCLYSICRSFHTSRRLLGTAPGLCSLAKNQLMSKVTKSGTMKLDGPVFQSLFSAELKALSSVFEQHNYELRIAGGAVRDLLTGKTPSDLDFATTATPEQMKKMFEAENIRMINRRGEQHGTITCRINDKENFEVTTLRIDVVTDGRHAQVEFTTDWKLDAERRDLTVNSMFLGLDGTLYDYFNGQQDLIDKQVRFVGDAAARIQEDFLRILRYFRFYGRISDLPNSHDELCLKAIRDNASGLAGISGERIWVELKKIVIGRHAGNLVRVMSELGVTQHLGLPSDATVDEFEKIWNRCSDLDPQPMTVLSSLLRTEDEVLAFHNRVKMSNDERDLAMFIAQHRDDEFGEDAFEHCADLICEVPSLTYRTKQRCCELLKYLNLRTTLTRVADWTPPRFPVRGEDVILAGVQKGRSVGKALAYLQGKWKESRYTMTAEELLQFIEEAKKAS